jgi:negative regulator of genetic competence, sporulation and motility
MKKMIALMLALALALSLAACAGGTTQSDNDQTNLPQGGGTNNNNNNDDNNDDSGKTENNQISFSEVVVVDNGECLIKITGIDPGNMWGYTLKAQLENRSTDKTYMFSVLSAAINGVECDPFFASEVAAGKKANEQIHFAKDELEEYGVTTLNEYSFLHEYGELQSAKKKLPYLKEYAKCICKENAIDILGKI